MQCVGRCESLLPFHPHAHPHGYPHLLSICTLSGPKAAVYLVNVKRFEKRL